MRRERGQGWDHGKHGLAPGTVPRPRDTQAGKANSQGRLCPLLLQNPSVPRVRVGPEVEEAWRGGAPGRLCYQGVSLRKGCRPLPSLTHSGTFKAQEPLQGWGRGNISCWWALDLPQDKGTQLCSDRMLPALPWVCPCAWWSHTFTHMPSLSQCAP